MAIGRIRGITIELTADTTKATKELKSFETATKSVSDRLKDINKVLKLNPTSTETLTQKQKQLALQVETTKQQLEAEKTALQQLGAGEQTEQTINQQERLNLQIQETTAKLIEAEAAYKAFGGVGVQQAAAVGKSLQTAGRSMSSAGRSMTMGVTAPLAILGGAGVKQMAEFEHSMAGVGAVSQATGEELDEMSGYARELAATTMFTANEVTSAYHYMALAGWEPTEMMSGLEGILNLTAASGEDLGRVSDIVTDSLTAMGEASDQSGRFADVLAVAMSKSNTNVDLLGEAFKYVAPVAGAMEYSIEDLTLALGTMANAGIKGSTAGTTLRTILTNMAKPTEQMNTAMEELGVSLFDNEGNMYTMREVMDQLRGSLGDMKGLLTANNGEAMQLAQSLEDGTISEEEYNEALQQLIASEYGAEGAHKAELAAMLAGKRGMAGLLAIVGAAPEEWDGLADSINNAEGTAQTMRETMENTLSGQFTILKSQVAELGMQFAESLMPAIKDAVAWFQNLVLKLQALDPETKATIVKIAMLVAAIGPLLLIGGKLLSGLGLLLQMPAKLLTGISTVTSALSKFAVSMGTTLGPLLAIGAAIALVVAAFVDLWTNSEEFRDKITAALQQMSDSVLGLFSELGINAESLLDAFKIVWEWFRDSMAPIFTTAIGTISDVFSGAVDFIKGLVQIVKGIFTGDWNKTWEGVKNVVTGAISAIIAPVKNLIQTFLDQFGIKFSDIKDKFLALVTALKDKAITLFLNLQNKVTEKIQNLYTSVTGIWTNLKTWFEETTTAIKDKFVEIFQTIKEKVVEKLKNLRDSAKEILEALRTWIAEKITAIKDKFVEIFQTIKEKVVERTKALRDSFKEIWTALKTWCEEKLGAIKDKFTEIFQNIKEKVVEKTKALRDSFKEILEALRTWISDKLAAIKTKFAEIFQSIKEKVVEKTKALRDSVKGVIDGLKESISTKLESIKTKFTNSFESIKTKAETAFNSIKEKITKPIESAKELVTKAVDKIKGLFPLSMGKIFSGIQLPHFKISGGKIPWGIGGMGERPKIDIEWYKKAMNKGMVLDSPTIFGAMNGKLLGAGEAGSETIVGTNSLMNMIQHAAAQNVIDPQVIYQAVLQGMNDAKLDVYMDGQKVTDQITQKITRGQTSYQKFYGVF